MASSITLVKHKGYRPPNALTMGREDGVEVCGAVAHTEWGSIPGKAFSDTCYYPYYGKEHMTREFSWMCSSTPETPPCSIQLIKNKGKRPANAVLMGKHFGDGSDLYCAVANLKSGPYPGKAMGNTCYYAWGQEYSTSDFSWVCSDTGLQLIENEGTAPLFAIALGLIQGDATTYFAGVAHSEFGEIPGIVGKAGLIDKDNACWYSFEGKQHKTDKFAWVCLQK